MTIWEIIKDLMTRGHKQGTAGYGAQMNRAAHLYCEIRKKLTVRQQYLNDKFFNADVEVTEALAIRKHLILIRLLKEEEFT